MTGDAEGTPHAMLHNVTHDHVVHEQVVLLTVETADEPYVPAEERLFSLLARNAEGATGFFRIPPNRVVEPGTQIEL